MMRSVRKLLGGDSETRDVVVVLGTALLLWEAGVRLFRPSPLILPAPSAIFAAFLETPALFMRHLGFTLGMTCIGFVLAVVLGVALAVGIVYSRFLERTIYTLLVALNSIPKVALAPLFVIWMGTGPEPVSALTMVFRISRGSGRLLICIAWACSPTGIVVPSPASPTRSFKRYSPAWSLTKRIDMLAVTSTPGGGLR